VKVIRPLCGEAERVWAQLNEADRVLIALDYDGTLAPLPSAAAVVLSELARSNRFSVAVVSGRSLADLKGKLGLDVIYVGNHGLEIEGAGISFVHPLADALRGAIDQVCSRLEAAFDGVRGVAVERRELSATVHYRQTPADLRSHIQATVNSTVRPYLSKIFVGPALEAWEIRPRLQWNKGSAVRYLLGRMDAISPALVCAGDDAIGEDIFGLLPWQISIKVGAARNTRARYYVRCAAELFDFLKILERNGRSAAVELTAAA
jgi:trehalose 6-phosphate phosphatase